MQAHTWTLYAGALVAVGAASGFAGGLFGIGGGLLRIPAFLYLFPLLGVTPDVVMHVSAGTSLGLAVPTALASTLRHGRAGTLEPAFLRRWLPGILAGVVVGTLLLRRVPGHVLVVVFGIALIAIALEMMLAPDDFTLSASLPGRAGCAASASVIGTLSTLLGLSGGVFVTPALVACSYPIHRALAVSSATALAIGVFGALGAVVNGFGLPGRPPYSLGYVDLPTLAVITPTVLLTAPLGVRAASRLPARTLRRVFGVFLLVIAADMLHDALVGP